jgi:hypothetical protein
VPYATLASKVGIEYLEEEWSVKRRRNLLLGRMWKLDPRPIRVKEFV